MRESALSPALIRVVVIVLFVVIAQILRARQSKVSKPVARASVGKGAGLDLLREAIQQASDQARAQRGELSPSAGEPLVEPEPLPLREQFEQPPTIQPESSFIPSLLLVALLACLCLMAYRYWAG